MEIENNILKEVRISDIDKSGVFVIPEGVKTIEDYAFYDCTLLKEITIPDSVKTIGEGAFHRCTSLEKINIPNSVKSIGKWAFYCCKALSEIVLPNSIETIGEGAFHRCTSLEKINIPNSVKSIGEYAFYCCKALSEIVLPNSIEIIGSGAFEYCCSLKEITLPDSIEAIGNNAFYYCNALKDIVLPDGVKTIGESAFSGCYSLKKIIIPNSVKTIGEYAFNYCSNLSKITYKSKDLNVKYIDGYCMIIKSSKNLDDYIIYKAYYFDDYANENLDIVYVAKKDGFTAHGKTLKQAISDVVFKILKNKDVSEHIMRIKSQGFVTPNDYRLITGACRQGTERFLTANNLTWDDKMEVSKVCELVKNEYGGKQFIEAMR